MKFRNKLLLSLSILFVISNLFFFINRNKGFEYKKFSNIPELYPPNPGKGFLAKWINYKIRFSSEELDQGSTLLNKMIGIDTIVNEEKKIISIAAWLYNSFYKQKGTPDSSISKLSPLQQYRYFSDHKEAKLWCGNFQGMVAFFCDAVKLPNRYVEIAPLKNNLDTHEVNEVFLNKIGKWVMIDATRNLIMIGKNDQFFSAAGYFDQQLKNDDDLFFIKADTISSHGTSITKGGRATDIYFNEKHFLRFYYTMDLSKVYAFWPRIKRYLLADPWYEIYSPQESHFNFLFRAKQFSFWGLGAIIIFIFFLYPSKKSI